MRDNVKHFLEEISARRERRLKALKARTQEDLVALAKELGIDLSEDDFNIPEECLKVDEDELRAVSGGGTCACVTGGYGKPSKKNDKECGCAIVGSGDWINGYDRCVCFWGGGGKTKD